jgi:hypothetical protein
VVPYTPVGSGRELEEAAHMTYRVRLLLWGSDVQLGEGFDGTAYDGLAWKVWAPFDRFESLFGTKVRFPQSIRRSQWR